MKRSRDRKNAIELLKHPRGNYIIAQAFFLVLKSMMAEPEEKWELKNMGDMMLLGLELFPTYFLYADPGQEEGLVKAA